MTMMSKEELIEQIDSQQETIAALRAEMRQLRAENAALRTRLVILRVAAEDMLSTYRHDVKTVLVTAERQEAWQKAINESETI